MPGLRVGNVVIKLGLRFIYETVICCTDDTNHVYTTYGLKILKYKFYQYDLFIISMTVYDNIDFFQIQSIVDLVVKLPCTD